MATGQAVTIDVKIEGLDKLMKVTDPAMARRQFKNAMWGAGQTILTELTNYPEPYSGAPGEAATRWTPKQRRWFWWAFKQGKVVLPYQRGTDRRSQKLGASWNSKVKEGNGYCETTVGTRVTYARYVMDEAKQAWIHKGRWQTVQAVVQKKQGEIMQFLQEAVNAILAA
jgi:hypothetical protein